VLAIVHGDLRDAVVLGLFQRLEEQRIGLLAALVWSGRVQYWHVAVLAAIYGLSRAIDIPARQSYVTDLVGRSDLPNAVALNSVIMNGARIVGPAVAGLLIAAFGVALAFFLNGVSFLAVIFVLTRIHYPERDAPSEGKLWFKLKQGFEYVFNHGVMSPLVVLVAITSLLAIPYLVFVPYFARDVLHSDEQGLGLLMACSGVGSFFGAVTIAYLAHLHNRGKFVVRSGTGFFLAIILFTFSRSFLLSGLLLMAAGYFMVVMVATINARLQHLADESMRGRVMSIYSTAFLGLPPLGSLAAGVLARGISPAHAIAFMSACALVACWAVFATSKELRELD